MASIYSWESFIRIHGGEAGARDVFEKLMDALLRAENHDKEVHIVKASQGDGGIDVYVHREDGIDIYQCKFFMETLNKIMDLYAEEFEEEEYFSNELKQKAGFSKDGDKGFEGIITGLQMQTYLCVHDFRQRRNRKGVEYGWPIAVYCTPEHLWGYDFVTSAYKEEPIDSAKRIARHLRDVYPVADAGAIRKVIGLRPGERKEPEKKRV